MSDIDEVQLEIRKLQSTDAAAFRSVRLAGLKEFPTAFGSSYEEEATQTVDEIATRLPPTPANSYFFLGAFADLKLVGIIAFQRGCKLKQQHGGSLYGAYVVPECRRKGIGHALVSAAIAEVRLISGMRFLQLWVGMENHSARSLYEQAGFKASGTLPAALCIDGIFYDEALMILDLTSPF